MSNWRVRVRFRVRTYSFKDVMVILNEACEELCRDRIWNHGRKFGEPVGVPFYRFRYPPGTGL
jgi:hypothetical protein